DGRHVRRDLEPALDLADVLRERVEARAVRHADLAAQVAELARDRIEDALVALAARDTLLVAAAAAEHALEDDLRVQLHRQRRRRRRPRDRVRVDAAIAFAAVARARARILARHLDRRQQRFAAVLLRD